MDEMIDRQEAIEQLARAVQHGGVDSRDVATLLKPYNIQPVEFWEYFWVHVVN